MSLCPRLNIVLAAVFLLAQGLLGSAPAASPYEGVGASPRGYQRTSGRQNPALEYFAGPRPQFQQGRLTSRPSPLGASRAVAVQPSKPFANYNRPPTISPYLSLDLPASEEALPNYYAFVRPQLDQQQRNQVQQAQYVRLQHQFNAAATGPTGGSASGELPTTGHGTQFMNAGGYFRVLK